MSGVTVIPVQGREEINVIWKRIERFLEYACSKGPLPTTTKALREACESGSNQLWVGMKDYKFVGALVTGVLVEKDENVLELCMVGGIKIDDWFDHLETITDMAQEQMNVTKVRAVCRPGIKQKLEPMGYKIKGYVMERHL